MHSSERVAAPLRAGLLRRGMTGDDLSARWMLVRRRCCEVSEAAWERRVKQALDDQPVRPGIIFEIHRVVSACPELRGVQHLIPDLTEWDGDRFTFVQGVLRIAVSGRGWSLKSLAVHSGLDPRGIGDVVGERSLHPDDAARVLRLLSGFSPDKARRAELAHIDHCLDPLEGVDVRAAMTARRWTDAKAAEASGVSTATVGSIRRAGGSWTSRAALRDALNRIPPLPGPVPLMSPLSLRHEMQRRGLDIGSLSKAAGITSHQLVSLLQGRGRDAHWPAIGNTLQEIPPLKGATDFLIAPIAAVGRQTGPRLDPARVADRLLRIAMSPGDFLRATSLARQVAVNARSGRQVSPATLALCLRVLSGPCKTLRWAQSPARVQRRLHQLSWTQEDLARRTGLSKGTISPFIRGASVSASTRRLIDAALTSPVPVVGEVSCRACPCETKLTIQRRADEAYTRLGLRVSEEVRR